MTETIQLVVTAQIDSTNPDGRRMALDQLTKALKRAGGSCPLPAYRCAVTEVALAADSPAIVV